MSQAEALLRGLTEPTTYSTNSDAVIVIGDDRFITVPDSLKRIAVQYDHDIETVSFDCPRFWDGHDMSQMQVYINYLLPNGKPGQYLAQNVSARGQRMTFDWTISNNVTQYRGNLSFLVCVKRSDSSGNEERHWNSELNRDLYISEGLECSETAITRYPDIITQLLTRMSEVEELATPEAMQAYADTWLEENHERVLEEINNKAEEVLASIPADYSATATLAEEGARTKANAIEQTAEGEVIAVNDSADAYLPCLKLYGKTTQVSTTGKQLAAVNINVADYAYMGVRSSATADGNIIVSGTSNDGLWNRLASADLVAGETYTLSSNGALVITIWDAVASTNLETKARNVASLTFTAVNTGYHTFVLANEAHNVFSSVRADIMLNAGSTALPWEPYSGGMVAPCLEYPRPMLSNEAVDCAVYGANLFPIREVTAVGVTGTPQEDGSILYTGTSDSNAWQAYQQCPIFESGTYTLSVQTTNKTEKGSLIQVIDENGLIGRSWQNVEDNFSCTFDTVAGGNVRWSIGVLPDEVVNTTVKLMLNPGSTAVPWEPYVDSQILSTTEVLSGIPVSQNGNYTDSNGQQWICDEIDFERGVYVQRVGSVTFADTTWSQNSSGKYFCNEHRGIFSNEYSLMCTHMHGGVSSNGNLENVIFINANHDIRLNVTLDDSSVENVAYVMRDAVLCGVLVTPIETPLTAEEIKNFKMVRSNYPNTTILNNSGVHMAVKYAADTKDYIENLIPEVGAITLTGTKKLKLASTGAILVNGTEDHLLSQEITVSPKEQYLVTCSANFGNNLYSFYCKYKDANGAWVKKLKGGLTAPSDKPGLSEINRQVSVPDGANILQVAWNKTVTDVPYAVTKIVNVTPRVLEDVPIAIIGDSIIEKNATANTNCVEIIAAETGAIITNLGMSGTGYVSEYEGNKPFIQRVNSIPNDTKRVLIFGSGNDLKHDELGIPLGSPEDTADKNTLCGHINATIDAVYARVPTAWVGIISSTPWQPYPPSNVGNKMALMVQAQQSICARRGIPFLNLYHASGLRPWDKTFREMAYHEADGVHPNDVGHAMIAPLIQAFLLGAVGGAHSDKLMLTSPDGTVWNIAVSNDGTLSAVKN